MVKELSSQKRKYYSLEHWQEVMAHWKKSSLSKKSYCEQHKIAHSVFMRWLKKIEVLDGKKVKQEKSVTDKFIPIHWVEGSSSSGVPRVDIVMANGHHLWMQGSIEDLSLLLKPLLMG